MTSVECKIKSVFLTGGVWILIIGLSFTLAAKTSAYAASPPKSSSPKSSSSKSHSPESVSLATSLSKISMIQETDPKDADQKGLVTEEPSVETVGYLNYEMMFNNKLQLCRDLVPILGRLKKYKFGKAVYTSKSLPFTAADKDFKRPKWQEVSIDDNMDIYHNIISQYINPPRYVFEYDRIAKDYRVPLPEGHRQKETGGIYYNLHLAVKFEEMRSAGKLTLLRARIDMNHDGQFETVYRFGSDLMGLAPYRPKDIPLEEILVYRYHILGNETGREKLAYDMARRSVANDLFYYKGRIVVTLPLGPVFSASQTTWRKSNQPISDVQKSDRPIVFDQFIRLPVCAYRDNNFYQSE